MNILLVILEENFCPLKKSKDKNTYKIRAEKSDGY